MMFDASACLWITSVAAGRDAPNDEESIWNIDHFAQKEFSVIVPASFQSFPFTCFSQTLRPIKLPKPTVQNIFHFVKRFFDKAHLNPG